MHPSKDIPAHRLRSAQAAAAQVQPAKPKRVRKAPSAKKGAKKAKAPAKAKAAAKPPRALVDQLKDKGA